MNFFEETGRHAIRTIPMGAYSPDLGRFTNQVHFFFSEVNEPDPGWSPEVFVRCQAFAVEEVDSMVRSGELACAQHVALWMLTKSAGFYT